MNVPLHVQSQRIQEVLDQYGFELQVVELKDSTRTAREAAATIGCELGQIVKSIIFKGTQTNKPVLVIASGVNQVSMQTLQSHFGEAVCKPDANFVAKVTGYVIGGVPPIGHLNPIDCYIDEDLLQYKVIWAAAGTPYSVFELSPPQLLKMTQGKVICIKK